jgi:uncharacterized protein YcfL
MNALDAKEIAVSLIMSFKILNLAFILLVLVGCSSSPSKPTSDLCSITKHWQDSLFQVSINDQPISKHWYTHADAVSITRELAANNKCMP